MGIKSLVEGLIKKFSASSRVVNESGDFDTWLSKPYDDEGAMDSAVEAQREEILADLHDEWLTSASNIQSLLAAKRTTLNVAEKMAQEMIQDRLPEMIPDNINYDDADAVQAEMKKPEYLMMVAKSVLADLETDETLDQAIADMLGEARGS